MNKRLPLSFLLMAAALAPGCGGDQPRVIKAPPPADVWGDDTLSQSNTYTAFHAATPPVIDGEIDAVWASAPWQAVDVLWLGAQRTYPTPDDYSGRFKVLWDEDQLYILMEVIDDVIVDHTRDPLTRYWVDDTVELFIDPDASGGNHQGQNFDNAWAYHISTYYDVVDSGPRNVQLFNDHITTRIRSEGTRHIWEMSVRIYDQGYDLLDPGANVPATLYSGKVMGFSICYIDNDNTLPSSRNERESMMGSVDTQGHKNNQGYINADVFGTLILAD